MTDPTEPPKPKLILKQPTRDTRIRQSSNGSFGESEHVYDRKIAAKKAAAKKAPAKKAAAKKAATKG